LRAVREGKAMTEGRKFKVGDTVQFDDGRHNRTAQVVGEVVKLSGSLVYVVENNHGFLIFRHPNELTLVKNVTEPSGGS